MNLSHVVPGILKKKKRNKMEKDELFLVVIVKEWKHTKCSSVG